MKKVSAVPGWHLFLVSGLSSQSASSTKVGVNAAVTLQRPLLIKGEPGTRKTMLAEEVAKALKLPIFEWHIKSTTKARQGLYEYDAVSRLRDSQLGALSTSSS